MAANFPIPAGRPDNVRREVDERQWVIAAMEALEGAWKMANDDGQWVSADKRLVSTEAFQRYHAQDEGYHVGREPIRQLDMRTELLRHIPAAQQDAARERLHARGTRDPPAPLVCNHFYVPDIGSVESNNNFNRDFPATLVYEYKVPEGPNAGRLMPVWIGHNDELPTKDPEWLIECGVTALMNLNKPGDSPTWHHPAFKCLPGTIDGTKGFWKAEEFKKAFLESKKLLKAWQGGGRLGEEIGGGVGWGPGHPRRGPRHDRIPLGQGPRRHLPQL